MDIISTSADAVSAESDPALVTPQKPSGQTPTIQEDNDDGKPGVKEPAVTARSMDYGPILHPARDHVCYMPEL
ncbi:hypothetical protein NDU88_000258 [Pleurodeles waltl]|uniref:Uncharacterized protein n=1 Tax=Pleurodeles waltl TaxID=8319 RepID=A0AAV7S9K6_PLEWA|nr:hypothetical protein NDU88_000258 [Pleurodeles waltl]